MIMYRLYQLKAKMKKKVIMEVEEQALELIDKAAKEEYSSRTSFLMRHGVKAAREILEVGE